MILISKIINESYIKRQLCFSASLDRATAKGGSVCPFVCPSVTLAIYAKMFQDIETCLHLTIERCL